MLNKGEPDLLACFPGPFGLGIFVAIEVKVPGEEPTDIQAAKLERWHRKGAIAFACDNPDDVVPTIRVEIERRKLNWILERRPLFVPASQRFIIENT